MPNFADLRARQAGQAPIDALDIFARLPKSADFSDLRPSQEKLLTQWHESARARRDNIIKLSTGGGKTLVGLLMAQSLLNELHQPVLYLSPNNQLVEQTLKDCKRYGLNAVPYTGRPHPEAFTSARAVLIANYDVLFNGKSTFGLKNEPEYRSLGGIILDDAHVAIGAIRKQFTLEITNTGKPSLYWEILEPIVPHLKSLDRYGDFYDILSNGAKGVAEVPHWIWLQNVDRVRELLAMIPKEEMPFEWPLIRNHLELCHCLFSAGEISITPFLPLPDLFPSFANCQRRIFMSATIADDELLAGTFDIDGDVANLVIRLESLAGASERMILVPNIFPNVHHEEINAALRPLATALTKERKGVIVLAPSFSAASRWVDIGDAPQNTDAAAAAISAVQRGESYGPLALASRYDGVDFPDDRCRLLILDGTPRARSDYESFRSATLINSNDVALDLAQRIEQGMGRGARGAGDHCVVVLLGGDLAATVFDAKNWPYFTPVTRAQLEIGDSVSQNIRSTQEFIDTVYQSINRDEDWVGYSQEQLAERVAKAAYEPKPTAILIERRAFGEYCRGERAKALDILTKAASTSNTVDISSDEKGWLLQLAARFALLIGNDEEFRKLQTTAHRLNDRIPIPADVPAIYVAQRQPQFSQAETILEHFNDFTIGRGYRASCEAKLGNLSRDSSTGQFEQAVADLGAMLGFTTDRPDKRRKGPDVLWLTHDRHGYVIEVKSQRRHAAK